MRACPRLRFNTPSVSACATVLGLAALVAATTGHAAFAAPSDSDLLTNFNAIVGDYSNKSDTQGAVLIGGNLTGSNTFDTKGQQPSASTLSGYGGVNVYGNTAGASYNSNNVAVKVATGNQGASFSGASSVTYNYAFPYTFNSIYNQLTTLSADLADLAGVDSSLSTSTLTDNANASGVAVLNITAQQLESVGNLTFDLDANTLLIINVDTADTNGSYSTQSGQNFTNGSNKNYASNILWNFYDATGTVNFGSEFVGSVLAPGATVTNSNAIDGTLVAQTFTGNGELHWYPLIDPDYLDTVVKTPEPASMALLGTGVIGLGLFRRRKARATGNCAA